MAAEGHLFGGVSRALVIERTPKLLLRPVSQQILKLHEDRAAGALVRLVGVAEAIVIPTIEHCPCIDAVGKQQVRSQRPIEGVVLENGAHLHTIRKLICCLRSQDFNVELFTLGARIRELDRR